MMRWLWVSSLVAATSVLTGCFDALTGETQPPVLLCADEPSELADRVLCSIELTSGYVGILALPADGDTTSVTVVDLGDPATSRSGTLRALTEVAPHSRPDTGLLGIVPPPLETPPPDCNSADPNGFVDACDVETRAEVHVNGYADSLDDALAAAGLDGLAVDLAGTSYASARWAQMTAADIGPHLRDAVITQPFAAGLTGDRLEEELKEVTRNLYAAVLLDGCVRVECLEDTVGSLLPGCEDPGCYPDVLLSDLVELPSEEILEGLMGMAPLVAANAVDIHDAYQNGDGGAVTEMIRQGRAAYLGLDPIGDLRAAEVDFLSAICPTLRTDDLGYRYRYCRNVPRSSLIVDDAGDTLADPDRAPQRVCLIATAPDPVLGGASMSGFQFGQTSARSSADGHFGHGDVELAAELLSTIGSAGDKQICSMHR